VVVAKNLQEECLGLPPPILLKLSGLQDSGVKQNQSPKLADKIYFQNVKINVQKGGKNLATSAKMICTCYINYRVSSHC